MKRTLISLLCFCALASLWFWYASPRSSQSAQPPLQQVAKPPVPPTAAAQSGFTNIPGLGPVPTDPKELERFKAKAKQEMQEALRTVGVFSNRADMKQAQDNGEMAWIYIEQRKNLQLAMDNIHGAAVEPYPPRMLEALQHILKHAQNPQLRLATAMLLFRYDQPAGKAYLLSVLNSPTTDLLTREAALALATNREREAIPGIVNAFAKMAPPPTPLLMALGQWQEESVRALLKLEWQRNPQSWGLALGLAQGGDAGAVSMLGKTVSSQRPLGYLQLTVEATLVKYQAMEASQWDNRMRDKCFKTPGTGTSTVLPAFHAAGKEVGVVPLMSLVASTIPLHEAYVAGMESQAKGIREKIPELANKFPKPPPSEFIMGAAQLLAQWDAKEAVPTLQQVLTTVQQGGRANVYVNEALGLALYKLDPANWRETLLNAGIPPYHVDRIPALAKLRPIPPAYLPKQVNLKAR